MDWEKLLTAFLGVYGAAITSYVIVRAQWEKRRELRVAWFPGEVKRKPRWGKQNTKSKIVFQIANPGERTVVIENAGIKARYENFDIRFNSSETVEGTFKFPYEVQGGHGLTFWVDSEDFIARLRIRGSGRFSVVAYVIDAIGKRYESKPAYIDPERVDE
jgi:hypothetical protein